MTITATLTLINVAVPGPKSDTEKIVATTTIAIIDRQKSQPVDGSLGIDLSRKGSFVVRSQGELASWISRTEGKSEVKRAAFSKLRLDPYSSRMFFDHHFCNVEAQSYAATILVMYL